MPDGESWQEMPYIRAVYTTKMIEEKVVRVYATNSIWTKLMKHRTGKRYCMSTDHFWCSNTTKFPLANPPLAVPIPNESDNGNDNGNNNEDDKSDANSIENIFAEYWWVIDLLLLLLAAGGL